MNIPKIDPPPDGTARPLWSVMIPTYNCAAYLQQTLASVLAQDPGPDQMQIEVVDDCSTRDNPEAVVRETGKGRVAFHRNPKNQGVTRNFNVCIQRSRGQLIHILHGDDYVLPGFYQKIKNAAEEHPNAALLAARSFLVDTKNKIMDVTKRLDEMEAPSHCIENFYYATPIQTPGVVMRRNFYEKHGGFHLKLAHTADCEMWARAIGLEGGCVTSEILACYRSFAENDSGHLARTAANLHDIERLNQIFAGRYPAFDRKKASERVWSMAHDQILHFYNSGDSQALSANMRYWRTYAPLAFRFRTFLSLRLGQILGR
jgi:glycosyltransferase involved in cell wall biosynthesis